MRKQNKKSKKQNMDINYLDLIPVRSEELHWHKDIKGRVILDVENTGLFNKIAQNVFNKPQYTKVHLDAQGTFIWPLIDGKRTVDRYCSTGERRIWRSSRTAVSENHQIFPDC